MADVLKQYNRYDVFQNYITSQQWEDAVQLLCDHLERNLKMTVHYTWFMDTPSWVGLRMTSGPGRYDGVVNLEHLPSSVEFQYWETNCRICFNNSNCWLLTHRSNGITYDIVSNNLARSPVGQVDFDIPILSIRDMLLNLISVNTLMDLVWGYYCTTWDEFIEYTLMTFGNTCLQCKPDGPCMGKVLYYLRRAYRIADIIVLRTSLSNTHW